jgi:hypothetical protein
VSPAAKKAPAPETVSIRMFQVGFGDCFLLSFGYGKEFDDGREERHLLIDFGSTQWPDSGPASHEAIAASIAERTGGKLDVIVATHRHKDHLSGFGDAAAGEILSALEPRLVVRPWTENPKLPADATEPLALSDPGERFAASLGASQEFAVEVRDALADRPGLHGQLAALAAQQIPNADAIRLLETLGDNGDLGARYLCAGQDSGIEEAIPGIEVMVLGPPTPEEWPDVTGQKSNDPEFWIANQGLLDKALADTQAVADGADSKAPVAEPGPERWLVERMRSQQTQSLLRIVRELDGALNNTSVILLIRVGKRLLLFPGDAQIENWDFSLKGPPAKDLLPKLKEVGLYKVGHHGSRNATPRSLVKLWTGRKGKLTSMLSTKAGVHGESKETAVPRSTLTEALADIGPLARTDSLPPDALYLELSGSTKNSDPFTSSSGT